MTLTQIMQMKKQIALLFIAAVTACAPPDKKSQLEQLRAERAALDSQIAAIEKELLTDTTNAIKPIEVTALALKPTSFKTYIDIQGQIDAEEIVNLSTEMPGTITKIHVKAGDKVRKDQVLAETDAKAVQQQMAALQTNLNLATEMYERQKKLWDQKIGTEMQFLSAKAQKEAAESSMAGMQETVRMSKIISPIDGTVDNVNIKLGQAVMPGVPAITVVNFDNLKVVAEVAESYRPRVKAGQEGLVILPDMNDTIEAEVTYAARAISPLTRTFKVEVRLDNKKEYHPNMVAKLKINDYENKKALVLPVKYLQKSSDGRYVYVDENGRAVRKAVKITREYNGLAEIESGVKTGDRIITEGYDLVNEGDPISTKK
jgi:membrane fusion protein, multidrug efflux system